MPLDVRFASGDGEVAAWLFRPDGDPPHAAVVLGHGFGATREARLDAYAERFRDAGLLAVAFDYRHFGASSGEPRQLISIPRQIEDWHAALAYTRGLDEVDPGRVAVWGTSFAGGHVLRVAAEDGAVAAVIAQVPFVDGLRTSLRLPDVSSLKMSAYAAADLVRGRLLGRLEVTVALVGQPGDAAAMATDDAVAGFERLYGGHSWTNRVCARIGLAVPSYRPIRAAPRVRCPLLVQAAEHDKLAPASAARRAADLAPLGRFTSFPVGHFAPYFDEWFQTATEEQVAFLREHLQGA